MRFGNENEFDKIIHDAIKRYPTVPMWVVKAVIAVESSFKPKAFNPETGSAYGPSRGLMQLTERTSRGLGFAGAFDTLFVPSVNIYYGVTLLAENFSRTGDWPDAISAYNGCFRPTLGFGSVVQRTVRCQGRMIPVGEYCNQDHVDRFKRYAEYYARKEGVTVPFLVPPVKAGMVGTLGLLAIGGALLLSLTRE